MQYFESKGELLEYLGKDRKDVRLVDRMMVRREVGKNERGYYVVREAWKERVEELERENEELKKGWVVVSDGEMVPKGLYEDEQRKNKELVDEIIKLEGKIKEMEKEKVEDGWYLGNEELEEKLKEAETNVKYREGQYNECEEMCKERIKKCYRFMTSKWIKGTWEEFRDFVWSD